MLVTSDGEVEKVKGLDSVCTLDYWSVGHPICVLPFYGANDACQG